MHELEENKPYYIRAWRHILEGWLHWPEDRISRWLQAMDADLEGHSIWFYHETATHYMIPSLIRDSLAERLQQAHSRGEERASDLIYFKYELFEAAAGTGMPEFDESYDWEAARRRVEALLARYGEGIPAVEEVTEYERRVLRRTA